MIRRRSMSAPSPRPLYYTFGNHMHWVDMQWLWGYAVLPGCTEDMLRFCAEAGVRGNVNFDGIGYEKMAAECPEALAKLRQAIAEGTIEPVGCSYGQPYGLFQGGESNIRQFEFGFRAVRKTLGVRPRAFWEEEFWFFPQLPQILAGFGYTGASLFFQWTWHTPELPEEEHALIRWRGLDGTELPVLPRNGLNLHQWPEDFDPMLESPLLESLAQPALVQWIELMPSPDWMCRAEVLLPRMKQLAEDPRFELRPRTLSQLIDELANSDAPVRSYTMDDVWHGMSLGKNADAHPRASLRCERLSLEAEALASMSAMLGRPYPSWDVYPHWELEEAWREQLAAQHHDNHECEGLCGFLGHDQFARAETMAQRVIDRSLERVARALPAHPAEVLVFNPLPWTRDIVVSRGSHPGQDEVVRAVPACGYRVGLAETPPVHWPDLPEELEFRLSVGVDGERRPLDELPEVQLREHWEADPIHPARKCELEVNLGELAWDPGFAGALALDLQFQRIEGILHDHPFAQTEIEAGTNRPRKYPSGDWMTSEQWFEDVSGPFTSQRLVQVDTGSASFLIVHDGAQAWQRIAPDTLRVILNLNDPWDEEYRVPSVAASFWVLDAAGLDAVQRHRLAEELLSTPIVRPLSAAHPERAPVGGGDPRLGATPPPAFSALEVEGPVACSAFRRVGPHEGDCIDSWAAAPMRAPHLIRLVELQGEAAEATLKLGLPIATAVRCNMLQESAGAERAPAVVDAHTLRVQLRPHEIQTLLVDLPDAAKQARDLDARRKVWEQIHRTESS